MLVWASDFFGWAGGIQDGCECSGMLGGILDTLLSLRGKASRLPGAWCVEMDGERGCLV